MMRNVTVNISFQDALLAEIDAEARREARTRSKLLREAARLYVRRQKQWEQVFALGGELSKQRSLTKADVAREIRNARPYLLFNRTTWETDISYLSRGIVLPILVLCHDDPDWMPLGLRTVRNLGKEAQALRRIYAEKSIPCDSSLKPSLSIYP
jgi:CopG family transcriptional regulator / antitoxin EndoAI